MRMLHTMLRVAPGGAGRGTPKGIDQLEGCPCAHSELFPDLGGRAL
jgi:hypothetical protein